MDRRFFAGVGLVGGLVGGLVEGTDVVLRWLRGAEEGGGGRGCWCWCWSGCGGGPAPGLRWLIRWDRRRLGMGRGGSSESCAEDFRFGGISADGTGYGYRYGMVWYGMVWYGMVWYGMVKRYGKGMYGMVKVW